MVAKPPALTHNSKYMHVTKATDFDLIESLKNRRNTKSYYSSAYTVVKEPEIVRKNKLKRISKLEDIKEINHAKTASKHR